MLVDGARVAKSRRLVTDEVIEVLAEPAVAGLPQPDPDVPVVVRYEDADVAGGGQARGARRAPGGRAPRRHAGQRAAGALPGDRRRSATRPGPASCTGSTATPAACSWWRGHRPRTRAWWRCSPPTTSSGATSPWCGACPTRSAGVIDAPIGRSVRRPTRMSVREGGRRRPHRVRGGAHVPRARRLAARVPARDRPHPPDPGAPPGHRPPGGRRRRVRRAPVDVARSTARSCTPAASRSPIRSPASRSGWRRSWRPSSRPCSESSGRLTRPGQSSASAAGRAPPWSRSATPARPAPRSPPGVSRGDRRGTRAGRPRTARTWRPGPAVAANAVALNTPAVATSLRRSTSPLPASSCCHSCPRPPYRRRTAIG